MTELHEGQHVERLIRVSGIDAPVVLTITSAGLSLRVKGTTKPVMALWSQVIAACGTQETVPSFLFGKPFELLHHYALKKGKK